MRLSEQLKQAKNAKIMLHVGQNIQVRTQDGQDVARGRIIEVDLATHTVRMTDETSGADLQVDVDVDRYDVYVLSPNERVPLWPPDVTLYVRPSMPGITKFKV